MIFSYCRVRWMKRLFRLQRLLLSALLVCLPLFNSVAFAQKMTVAFINPTSPDEPFWGMFTDFMGSVANDLDIHLDVHYSDGNRFKSLDIVKNIVESDTKPDYLVFNFQAQTGALILALAEKAGIHAFSVNTDVPESERHQIGSPRGKFKHWLGHMSPNDFQAGYTLAQTLVEQAEMKMDHTESTKLHIVGLTGSSDNSASVNRNRGLETFVSTRENIVLHQIVNAVWSRDKAKDITEVLLRRYPNMSIVWTASDLMSLGAIDAAKFNQKRVNNDFFSGGIDGTKEALSSIMQGGMSVTMTGHFVEGGWALMLLKDYHHNIDFISELGLTIYTDMTIVTQENAKNHTMKYEKGFFDQIDFKQFAKATNSKLKSYDFQLPRKPLH